MNAQAEYTRAVLRMESALRGMLAAPNSAGMQDNARTALDAFWTAWHKKREAEK